MVIPAVYGNRIISGRWRLRQCGPIRFNLSARKMTETNPFEHRVIPRATEFQMPPENSDVTIQDIYAALVDDRSRNELITADLLRSLEAGRSPLF
jgi:hypothetical protein